ncbi:hypothetical protein LINPERHAP1_LOCUS31136, partial [Linum perenne]
PDENFLSYQEIVNCRGEAENNLSNSSKHFMLPTISTASREKGVAERNESDLFLDDSPPIRRHVVRRREIREKGMKEAPISGDFETEKKVGCCSSVSARVVEPAAPPTTENKEIPQGDAAMHGVSEIEGEDLSPEASSSVAVAKPLIRKMVHDYDDDGNSTSSIVQMIVVTAISSGMVLLVLISCMLVRKRRNVVAGYYHQYQRHVEPSLVRRQDPNLE